MIPADTRAVPQLFFSPFGTMRSSHMVHLRKRRHRPVAGAQTTARSGTGPTGAGTAAMCAITVATGCVTKVTVSDGGVRAASSISMRASGGGGSSACKHFDI